MGAKGRVSFDAVVVDDDPDVGTSTVEVLRSDGLRAAQAVTMGEARGLLASGHVGCLILDHTLAVGESGWTEIGQGVPIILFSGTSPQRMAELQELYGDRLVACMAKPIHPTELIKTVRRALKPSIIPGREQDAVSHQLLRLEGGVVQHRGEDPRSNCRP
jgi:DNA-binding NtrC family response regulator